MAAATQTIKAPLQEMEWDSLTPEWTFTPKETNSLAGEVWAEGFVEKVEVAL